MKNQLTFAVAVRFMLAAQALPAYRLRTVPGPGLIYINSISNDGTYVAGEEAAFSSPSYLYTAPYKALPQLMP